MSLTDTFLVEMSTLRNKKKLAAVNEKNCEGHIRSNVGQYLSVPRSQDDYITQVCGKIEGRVTKKLSQEFSGTQNHILGKLSRLDETFLNTLFQGHSRVAPETSQNALGTNQGTNEDDSQSDPHPEASIFHSQTTQNPDPDVGHDICSS